MEKKTYMCSVSEAKVMADLTVHHYDVFNQASGKSPFDLVAHKDGILYRVQIKSCERMMSSGKFNVQLRKTRHNKKKNRTFKFEPSSCDILAVYLFGPDKIYYLDPQELGVRNTICIDPNEDLSFERLMEDKAIRAIAAASKADGSC